MAMSIQPDRTVRGRIEGKQPEGVWMGQGGRDGGQRERAAMPRPGGEPRRLTIVLLL